MHSVGLILSIIANPPPIKKQKVCKQSVCQLETFFKVTVQIFQTIFENQGLFFPSPQTRERCHEVSPTSNADPTACLSTRRRKRIISASAILLVTLRWAQLDLLRMTASSPSTEDPFPRYTTTYPQSHRQFRQTGISEKQIRRRTSGKFKIPRELIPRLCLTMVKTAKKTIRSHPVTLDLDPALPRWIH